MKIKSVTVLGLGRYSVGDRIFENPREVARFKLVSDGIYAIALDDSVIAYFQNMPCVVIYDHEKEAE